MKDVTFIIPARNEEYLEATIRNILANIRGDSEIIAVLDGYLPNPQIVTGDKRVRFLHNKIPLGHRAATNQAARIANGKYICKIDAHCAIDEGFDVKMMADCDYDWTVIPRLYNLDIKKFEPKWHKRIDYMFISSPSYTEPFRAQYYKGREWKEYHRNRPQLIDDTLCNMGPCFFMHKDRFWELGGCDENHVGGQGQQGVEVSLKAWLSGGSLKVNKKTWFSHWFRTGDTAGSPWPVNGALVEKSRAYSRDLWLNNKWPGQVRPLSWLLEKFWPVPTWTEEELAKMKAVPFKALHVPEPYKETIMSKCKFDLKAFYEHTIKEERFPRWMGTPIVKYPNDILLYQEILYRCQPDFLVESGTYKGGSALFFAHMMDLIGHGQVITNDLHDHSPPKHPRITHLVGRATADDTLAKIRSMISGKVMVVLDSNHHRSHVKRELSRYSKFVTSGQYLVVEDTNWSEIGKANGPDEAVKWFLAGNNDFVVDPLEERFVFSLNPGGWLVRK